ncbi:hypothetical protein MMC25_006680 [Agyrium rufum]|nr:hypothetical protein [Agyrium rufum]
MSLQLVEVTSEADFEAIARTAYAGFRNPPNPFSNLYNDEEEINDEHITKKAPEIARAWLEKKAECYWLKVVDSRMDNEIIAVACWSVHQAPYSSDVKIEASWQPEGSTIREFTSQWLAGLKKDILVQAEGKSYIELDQIATHPTHRLRGAADLLLQWGYDKAVELASDIYLLAVPSARVVYEKRGYTWLHAAAPDLHTAEPNAEWRSLQERYEQKENQLQLMKRSPANE